MEKDYLELFAGVGGFRLGLDRAGFSCRWFNQWEPADKKQIAFNIYRERFGDSLRGDENKPVQDVDKHTLPAVSLVVGGFPCQDYSKANLHRGGLAGNKGALWFSILDVIDAICPPFCLFENVPSIRRVNKGQDWIYIQKTLLDRGYSFESAILNAADFGLSQRRQRLFLFVWRNDTRFADEYVGGFFANVKRSAAFVAFKDILKPWEDRLELTDFQLERMKKLKGEKVLDRHRADGSVFHYREGACPFPENLENTGRTVTCQEGALNRVSHVIRDPSTGRFRWLNETEAEVMQGFPENWTAGASRRWRLKTMGNAVAVDVVAAIGDQIAKIIEKE